MLPLSISHVAKLCNFLLSPFSMTSNFLIPSFSTHLHFPCLSPLFFLHFSLSWSNSPFLNTSFSFFLFPLASPSMPPFLSPLYAPLPSFSLPPPTCPRVSGLAPVTLPLHYITATYNTLISLNAPRGESRSSAPIGRNKILLVPYWSPLHVDLRRTLR